MKSLFQTTLLLPALIWLSVTAAESPVGAGPPLYRYLIVVDTSPSMAREKDVAADVVGKLVAAGINGRIQTGDLLGVWTIGDKLNPAAFGPKMWNDTERPDVAGRVFALVRDAKSSKPANLGIVLAAVKEAAKASGSLTVFLVTDGSVPVQGTPFDDAINEVFRGHAAAMKKAKSPFVLVLNAQDGELVSQAISPGGAKIYIPPNPRHSTDAAVEQDLFGIKRPGTNPVDQAAALVKTNAPKTLSVAEISGILLKQQDARTSVATGVAPAGGDTNTTGVATNSEAKPAATETAAVTRPVAAVPSQSPTNAPGSDQTPSAPVNVTSPDSATVGQGTASSNLAAGPSKGDLPAPKAASEEPAAAPTVQQTAVMLTESPAALSSRYLMMAGGLFLVALILGWLLIRWRRPRSNPSLITRSLRERDRQ